jgi:hypothetical protein
MSLVLNGSDGLSDVDGSAATPAIRGTDANTGIFFPAADTIAFAEGGTEVMRIDSSGNVGIGTSSTSVRLKVQAGSGSIAQFTNGSDADLFIKLSGGVSTITPSTGVLAFGTSDTERARIDSNGNLLVGATSAGAFPTPPTGVGILSAGGNWQLFCIRNSGANAGAVINVSTAATTGIGWDAGVLGGGAVDWSFRYNANTRASINSSTGAYTALSDVNKKKNFEESTVGLAEVMQIETTLFHMLDAADDAPKELGFIAQQIEPLIPQAFVDVNGFIGLQDRPILAAAIKAIQEQQAIITALTARVAALESQP